MTITSTLPSLDPPAVTPANIGRASAGKGWTEARAKKAIWKHLTQGGYAVTTEVSVGSDNPSEGTRRIDLLAVRRARRVGLGPVEMLAVEVKVSRADFLSDVAHPEKQQPWRDAAHRHAYAVPDGLVHPDEVPAGSGLIVLREHTDRRGDKEQTWDTFAWLRKAPYVHDRPLTPKPWLMLNFAFRAGWAEGRERAWSGLTDGEESIEDLRGQVSALTKRLNTAEGRADRATRERDSWKAAFAATGGVPCGACGELVRPTRLDRYQSYAGWRHTDKAHDGPCLTIREAAALADARRRWETSSVEVQQMYRRGHHADDRRKPDQVIRDWAQHVPPILPAPDPELETPDEQ